MDNIYKGIVAFGGGTISYLYGGWSMLLGVLLFFVVSDYITGVIASYLKGRLSSKIGYRGVFKKFGIFLVVAIAYLVDGVLGTDIWIRDATIFFYLGTELISITENLDDIGVDIPTPIKKAIAIINEKGEGK